MAASYILIGVNTISQLRYETCKQQTGMIQQAVKAPIFKCISCKALNLHVEYVATYNFILQLESLYSEPLMHELIENPYLVA